jgi:hypothetical protein
MGLLVKHPTNSITLKLTFTCEDLDSLNFKDFLNIVEHMRATIFWNKGEG